MNIKNFSLGRTAHTPHVTIAYTQITRIIKNGNSAHADTGWHLITFLFHLFSCFSNHPSFEPPRQGGSAWCHGSCFELVCLGCSRAFGSCDALSLSCALHVPGLVSQGLRAVHHVPRDAHDDGDDDACVSSVRRNCVMKTHIKAKWNNMIGSSSTWETAIYRNYTILVFEGRLAYFTFTMIFTPI